MRLSYIYFILGLLLPYGLFAQNDTIISYYDKDWKIIDSKAKAEYYRISFKQNGLWQVRDYFINDSLQMSGAFKGRSMSFEHGPFVYYHENGQISEKGVYHLGKRVHKWFAWYDNGQKKYEIDFDAGLPVGLVKTWYENGNLESIGKFNYGLEYGIWGYYYKSGVIKAEGEWENGLRKGLWKYYYDLPDHPYKLLQVYENGYLIATTALWKNGKTHIEGNFLKDKRHGAWKNYDASGKLIFEGNYKNGQQKGEWIRYFKTSKHIYEFKNGKPVEPIDGIVIRSKDILQ